MTKTWFITGATRGLGKEIALAALGAGETVVATGRNAENVELALADANAGDRLLATTLDVTDAARLAQVVKAAIDRFGRIDVLVNNAGYGQLGFFETLAPEQVETQYRTNVFGLFNVTRAVLPQLRAQRSGHILNISSIGGVVGFGGAAAYTSSKFAIEGFSEDLAIDLKPFGIHVTIVEPGFFRTDFLENSSVKYGEVSIDDYADADAKQRAQYGAHSGKQLGDPAKLGQALLTIVAAVAPPLRYAAGSDAVEMTRNALKNRLIELDRWRELSESTDSNASVKA
ncbi:MAG: SDR family NAD(P)-dependent oxidoreductase [Phycisphaerales bacterium]|nr:SDR family NAD(P)-dependent oxidoreductase [Hyphomonadaceae bacterium]